MMGFGFLGMLLFWGLFLALVAGGVIFLVRSGRASAPRGDAAIRILDERLARGEISREEYETIRATLQQNQQ